MAFESRITSPLVMVQADLAFAVLEAPLDAPPRESRQEDCAHRHLRRSIAHKELHPHRIQHMTRDH